MSRCFEGRTTRYLSSNLWAETVTHLHEQSPAPVSGKTTRDVTITNARGEEIEARTEAYIDGMWYTISRNRMTYNAEGKRTSLENIAGQVTTTAWDCCHIIMQLKLRGRIRMKTGRKRPVNVIALNGIYGLGLLMRIWSITIHL